MKYSLIIISNRRQNVLRCLQNLKKYLSLKNDAEIIIVEATEDKNSLQIDIELPLKHIVIPTSKAGFSYQRNLGIENSEGKYVVFLDDDIEITEGWSETLLRQFEEHQNKYFGAMGAVFPKRENANFISFCIGVLGHPGGGFRLHSLSKGKIIELSQVATCNTVFKKDILIDVGMFNIENRYGGEDTDLCLRITYKYGENRFIYLPEALAWHDTCRSLVRMINWYIRRGKADIDLAFTNKVHCKYVFETSLLLKFFVFYILGFLNRYIFISFCAAWYLFQLWKHRFMWKYFGIYNFSTSYRIFTFFVFPVLKFIADVSLDIGRIVESFSYLKRKWFK